jgi:IS30 family transposase
MEKKTYSHINDNEREQIYYCLRKGKSKAEIGKMLGRDRSTIYREIGRNMNLRPGEYLPDTATHKAVKRREAGRKRCYLEKDWCQREYVLGKLKEAARFSINDRKMN